MSQKPSDLSCWFLKVRQDGISLKVKRSIGEVAELDSSSLPLIRGGLGRGQIKVTWDL
jgi:hypothetical protein